MQLNDLWFISQYKKPYLNISKTNILAQDDCNILIDDNDFELDLELESQEDRDLLLEQLYQMVDSDNMIWSQILSKEVNDILIELLNSLYVSGYIWDAQQISAVNMAEIDKLDTMVDKYSQDFYQFVSQISGQDKNLLITTLELLFSETFVLLRSGNIFAHSESVNSASDIWETDNFYLLTLIVQLGYLQKNNPVALLLIAKFLRNCREKGIYGQQQQNRDGAARSLSQSSLNYVLADYTSNVYSLRDAEAALFAFVDFIKSSLLDSAMRLAIPKVDIDNSQVEGCSGINFALQSENYARECTQALGHSNFFSALQDVENHALLAPACYLQEYFVNYRFVETITPMITKRLTPKFKQMFWRYYDEEIGHEKYELETCKQLGLTEQYIADSLPLPLTQAFCDAYSYLSENETIGYLTSVMVTEGIPGEPSLINDILSKSPVFDSNFNDASAEHEHLNQELGHQFLSRIFLAELDFISNKQQSKALNILSYMVELNFRAWENLYERLMVDQKGYLENSYVVK